MPALRGKWAAFAAKTTSTLGIAKLADFGLSVILPEPDPFASLSSHSSEHSLNGSGDSTDVDVHGIAPATELPYMPIFSTPAFMAPEMFAPPTPERPDTPAFGSTSSYSKLHPPQVFSGTASDVYSLGATLYTMVVGHPPFLASTLAELESLVTGDAALVFPADLRPALV